MSLAAQIAVLEIIMSHISYFSSVICTCLQNLVTKETSLGSRLKRPKIVNLE